MLKASTDFPTTYHKPGSVSRTQFAIDKIIKLVIIDQHIAPYEDNYFTLDNILQVSVVHPNGIFAETFLVPLTGLSTTLVMTTFTELQNGQMT